MRFGAGDRRCPDRRRARAVGRDQPVGRDLGQRPRMVSDAVRRRASSAGADGPAPPPRSPSPRPIAVGILATALGIWRLLPGVGFWDTAEFQTVPPILGTAHPTGFPTYVLLGWLASAVLTPFGEPAFRMNLLSAILVGVAAGITVDLVRRPDRLDVLGVVAGLGLAATPIVWAIATHADPHALHLAFVAAILWLLVRWERARRERPGATRTAGSWPRPPLTGLSVGNHSLTLLLAPPIALYVLAVEPRILRRCEARRWRAPSRSSSRRVLVYLELPLRGGGDRRSPGAARLRHPGHAGTASGTSSLGEQFRGGLNDPFGDLPRQAGRPRRPRRPPARPARARSSVVGFVATAIRRPRVRPAHRQRARHHAASSTPPTSTPTSSATTSGRRSSPGPGWRSSPRTVVDARRERSAGRERRSATGPIAARSCRRRLAGRRPRSSLAVRPARPDGGRAAARATAVDRDRQTAARGRVARRRPDGARAGRGRS